MYKMISKTFLVKHIYITENHEYRISTFYFKILWQMIITQKHAVLFSNK